MNCPNCQTENRDDARFCSNCGHALFITCPNCGEESPPSAKFCFNCGHALAFLAAAPDPEPDSLARMEDKNRGDQSRIQRFISSEMQAKLESARAGHHMEGERRIVTILFGDIVGSTAAAEQLDPEVWTEIMNGAFEHLISPIYRYEGTVARLMGDAILAFFGAPIAHEDDPQRAILAALEIVEEMNAYRQEIRSRHGVAFDVRVGINTGMVVVGTVGTDLALEYTAMGDAVNMASRMEQSAAPGTVQITADTHMLVSPLFDFEDLGGIQVKGKVDLAADYFEKSLHNQDSMVYFVRPFILTGRALVALARGELEEATAEVVEGLNYVEERKMREFYPMLALTGGRVSLARGEQKRALEQFNRAEALGSRMTVRPLIWQAQAGAAKALAALGQESEAALKKQQARATIDEIAALFQDQALRDTYLQTSGKKLQSISG